MRGRFLWASTAVLLAGCTTYKPLDDGSQVPWATALSGPPPNVAGASIVGGQPQTLVGNAAAEPAAGASAMGGAPMRITPLESGAEMASGATITPAVARQPEAQFETETVTETVATVDVDARPETHTVTKGDWLLGLAREYEVDPKALAAANGLAKPYTLRIGQVLQIPEPGTETVVMAAVTEVDTSSTVEASGAVETVKTTATATHLVARGDALYGIARQHGVTPTDLAAANDLNPADYLVPGQELVIPKAGATAVGAPPVAAAPATAMAEAASAVPAATESATFIWPVDGKVIASFGDDKDGESRSGIAIEARKGAPVKASRDGVVVYAGDAIRGYGRMILLRHEGGYVTAYGHNSAILVNVGDTVEQDQVIARVGDTGGVPTPQLHFEVRQGKQPIDPTTVLSARPAAVAQSTT